VLPDTYQIETWEEIDPDWLYGKSKVGITSGASTPEWVITEVVARLKAMISERAQRKTSRVFSISKQT
jgi:4-hydroxy-3-methylbut-2-enyl diphosphate reductase